MKIGNAAVVLLGLAIGPAFAQVEASEPFPLPERIVTEDGVLSERDPAIRVSLPGGTVHAGAKRWPLYNVADAELHAFVEADETGLVRRYYWVQFESYLPSRPNDYYRYAEFNPVTMDLSGYKVHVSPIMFAGPDFDPPDDTDHAAFRKLLSQNGFRLPPWTMSVRFVHLPTADLRQEVMVIYGEDLNSAGEALAAAMREDGDGKLNREDIAGPLIERAKSRIKLVPHVAIPQKPEEP